MSCRSRASIPLANRSGTATEPLRESFAEGKRRSKETARREYAGHEPSAAAFGAGNFLSGVVELVDAFLVLRRDGQA
jgi:hypothetical protein